MKEFKKRSVAIRAYISEIKHAVPEEIDGITYLITETGLPLKRVKVIGTVIDKFIQVSTPGEEPSDEPKKSYGSITLVDSTDTIRVKVWGPAVKQLDNIEVEDLVMIVGKPRIFGDEIYITPEFLRKINNPNWLLYHEAEILLRKVHEKDININVLLGKLIDTIKSDDKGNGVTYEYLINKFKNVPEPVIRRALVTLLNNGDIYEYSEKSYKFVEG
ncbi:MAG: hypothetical protein J7L47_08035 [Candidatus Odinarchaeota archaeon]|nr:hypothetical protein [Candidatus Odinarchaeota archaeon]